MHQERKALLYALSAVAMWSTVATAFKIALTEQTPAQLLFWAAVSSVLILSLVLSVQKKWHLLFKLSPAQWRWSLLYGALNPTLYYLLLFSAYNRLPAQEAQALNYTWALTLAFLAVPFLKQRLRPLDVVAGIVCYFGVLVIATRGQVFDLNFSDATGVSLALISTLVWASYWILNTRDQREPVLGLWLNFVLALPLLAIVNLWQGSLLVPSWQGIAGAAYVGVFEMGLAFVCWLQAMRLTQQTAKISNLIFLSPFVSLILIVTLLDEPLYPSTLIGLAFILTGLFLQQFKKNPLKGQKPHTQTSR